MGNAEKLKTLEGTKSFVESLSNECRKNLIEVIKEELEMMKKYRIIVQEELCYTKEKEGESEDTPKKYNNKVRYSSESIYSEGPLTAKLLDKIFEKNNVNREIIKQDLIDKIDNKNLNPKEAESLVSLLSKTCVFGYSRPTEHPYRRILSYYFAISPGEMIRYSEDCMNYRSFEEVLANKKEARDRFEK